ncbi:MAG: hypothetical protein WC123_03595 [Bacilli bacterium]
MIVNTYNDWLAINEAYENGLITLCHAYSSETNVMQKLGDKLNIDITKKYTVTLKSIEHVIYLPDAIKSAKVENVDPNQNDILIINNQSILEQGSILLNKANFNNLTITASNNSILTLTRLAKCFTDMKDLKFEPISKSTDALIKLSIGNKEEQMNARGYSFAAINPNKARSTANGIANALMLALAEFGNMNPNKIDYTSNLVKPYINLIRPYKTSKNYQESLTLIGKYYANALKQNNFLVANEFFVDPNNFIKALQIIMPYLKQNWNNNKLLRLPSNIINLLQLTMQDIATAICYGGESGDFNQKALNLANTIGFGQEAIPIISKYAGVLRNIIANGNINNGFNIIQTSSNKQPGSLAQPSIAQKSVGRVNQQEGEF